MTILTELRAWSMDNPLKRFRVSQDQKVTLLEAAGILRVSLLTIQAWEAGTQVPTKEETIALLKKLLGEGVMDEWQAWLDKRPQM